MELWNDRGGAGPEVTGEEAGRGVMGCSPAGSDRRGGRAVE